MKNNVARCVFSLRTSSKNDKMYDVTDRIVAKQWADLKRYEYLLPDYLVGQVNPGDVVLVHCATGYQVCEVDSVVSELDCSYEDTLAPVVCKIDMSQYVESILKAEQIRKVKSRILVKAAEVRKQLDLEELATRNSDLQAMLDEFVKAGGTW